MEICLAETDDQITRCYPVMAELRPHIAEGAFVPQVRRQMDDDGYELAYVETGDGVRAVAGYRFGECLAWGSFLYVDDLVTMASARSAGHGGALLDWLFERARVRHCDELHLDSGVQRFAAHRFYLRKRMDITSHHFAIRLAEVQP